MPTANAILAKRFAPVARGPCFPCGCFEHLAMQSTHFNTIRFNEAKGDFFANFTFRRKASHALLNYFQQITLCRTI